VWAEPALVAAHLAACRGQAAVRRFLALAAAVAAVFVLSFGPFVAMGQLPQVGRGSSKNGTHASKQASMQGGGQASAPHNPHLVAQFGSDKVVVAGHHRVLCFLECVCYVLQRHAMSACLAAS
jgi:hypothetical protein